MSRFFSYLGIAATLILGVLIIVFVNSTGTVRAPIETIPLASSTVSVLPPSPPVVQPKMDIPTTPTTTTPKKVATPTPTPTSASAPVQIPIKTVPIVAIPSVDNALLDTSASALRAALVNILCRVVIHGGQHIISGSGVFVDAKGTILTNAHIAEYFLLADRGASCSIRSGSPATDRYRAALIFISPAWIHANPDVISKTAPSGTGEYDFALLAVTKSVTESAFPISFPSIPLTTAPVTANTPVVIASYGAQFLDQSQILTDLSPTVVFGSIKDIFTFHANTIDVLALGGSAAAQEGSSGGGVADVSGKLVGTITTSTISGDTNTRSLDAITASYVRADYASETGQALDLLLAKPTATAITEFALQIPELEALIVAHL